MMLEGSPETHIPSQQLLEVNSAVSFNTPGLTTPCCLQMPAHVLLFASPPWALLVTQSVTLR